MILAICMPFKIFNKKFGVVVKIIINYYNQQEEKILCSR